MAHNTIGPVEMPVRRFDGVPRQAMLASLVLVAVGVIAFIVGALGDADRVWRAYLFNWLYFAGLAQGAVIFAVAVSLTRGIWSRPIRRIATGFAAFIPVSYILLFPLLLQADRIFPWVGGEGLHGAQGAYLNVPFLSVRNIVLLGAMLVLSLYYVYAGLRPDIGALRDDAPPRLRELYDRLTGGWLGQEQEETRAARRQAVLGPVLALMYAISYSVVAFDFVMSLRPGWFSTLIGPYVFMAAFLGGLAATTMYTVIYRSKLQLQEVITGPRLHDLGKLLFGFSILWAYLFWAQFLVIWYGLLPGEQAYIIERLEPPYLGIALTFFVLLFVAPFALLLGVAPKRSPKILGTVACMSLVGLWLERYVLIYPAYYEGGPLLLGVPEIGIALGFAGLLIAATVFFASRFPMVQLWEPYGSLELEISGEEPPGTTAVTGE